ncbi:MAG: hypothetical protein KGK08_11335 [Acidobacteriota bacterium]|nr:hypothetical protein [Acidobacteriota bacterium]
MSIPGKMAPARQHSAAAWQQLRSWLTVVHLHYAGVVVLAALNLYLLVHIGLSWRAANGEDAGSRQQQRMQMQQAEKAAEPLRGVDAKLQAATRDADRFYAQRLPGAYSDVLAELGTLTRKSGVKLTRVQYAPAAVLAGGPGALTEVRMDASLSGDYRPLMEFLNSLERDRMFFLVQGVTLAGQQSGTVGVRMRLTTYLRGTAPQPAHPAQAAGATATGGGQ